MAPTQWSNLPGDILSVIVKLLSSDVDLLRIRSVCSSWRSSLPTRLKPYSFPMKVPPVLSKNSSLNCSTLYRLSPPDYAGDSSDGWLLRVLEVKPNTFSLLTPLLPEKIGSRKERIPEYINLLNYRITEICKCYKLDFVDDNGFVSKSGDIIWKAIVLWNFVEDCEFAVLILIANMELRYWKFGDKDWTYIDTQGYRFDDVIIFDGKCYAIGLEGELVSFDSRFNISFVFAPEDDLKYNHNNFVVNKSDLYVVSKIYRSHKYSSEFQVSPSYISTGDRYNDQEIRIGKGKGSCEDTVEDERTHGNMCGYEDGETSIGKDKCSGEDIVEDKSTCYGNMGTTDDGDDEDVHDEIPLGVKIVRICNGWDYSVNLKDDEFFLSSDDVSAVLSTKDFGGCKGNCVYIAHIRHGDRICSYNNWGIEYGDHHGVFDFDGCRRTTLVLEGARSRAKIYWPPPNWLSDGSSSSRF